MAKLLEETELERAARFYCDVMSLDPEERVPVEGSTPVIAMVPGERRVKHVVPRWAIVAAELRSFELKLLALGVGREK